MATLLHDRVDRGARLVDVVADRHALARGEAVGTAIAALVSILVPARVILAGPLASAVPFTEGFQSVLQNTQACATGSTAIIRSTLSDLQAAEVAGLEWFAFSEKTLDPGET